MWDAHTVVAYTQKLRVALVRLWSSHRTRHGAGVQRKTERNVHASTPLQPTCTCSCDRAGRGPAWALAIVSRAPRVHGVPRPCGPGPAAALWPLPRHGVWLAQAAAHRVLALVASDLLSAD